LAARIDAARKYAEQMNQLLTQKIAGDAALEQADNSGEFNKFYAVLQSISQEEIKNVLTPSYALEKKNPDGTKEYREFFLVNEDKASAVRIKSLERAAQETSLAQKYAREIEEFIKQEVPIKPKP
jgi:hypothetical protein